MLSSNRRVASSLVSDFVMAFKRRSISACSSRRASARCRVADAWSLEALVAPERASWASASCQLHQYCWQSKEGAAQSGDVPDFAGALAGRGGWRVGSRDSRSRQRPGFCHSGSLRPLYARATAAKAERSSWLARRGGWASWQKRAAYALEQPAMRSRYVVYGVQVIQ